MTRSKHLLLRRLEKYPRLYKGAKKIVRRTRFSIRKGRIRRFLHWLLKGHVIRYFIVKEYLADHGNNLQVGGGYHTIDGWLNGDLIAGNIYLDATKPLQIPSESMDFIFAEQFIEHISLDENRKFMQECYRILKPNGVIRVSTPDLERLIQVYYDKNPRVSLYNAMERHRKQHNRELTTACHFLNDFFRLWGHRFIYDEETLKSLFMSAGFIRIKRCRFGESRYLDLKNRERHANVDWMESAFVIICEATKPQIVGDCNG
jgi:predicted SAM-dependent methyltransferase